MTTESNNTTVEVSETRLLEITRLASKLRTKTVRVHDLSGVGYNDDEDCHRAADLLEALTRRSSAGVRSGVTIEYLQSAHAARQEDWCPDQKPDLSFRGNEMAGEVGEACNVIKKLERERHGWRGSRDTVEHLGEELADVVHTAILCAITAGIDLGPAVIAKFNATSIKNDLPDHVLSALEPLPVHVGEEAGAVAWATEPSGLEVATIEHDEFSLIEISKGYSRKNSHHLTIHRLSEETGRRDDLSIELTESEAQKVADALRPSPAAPAQEEASEAFDDKWLGDGESYHEFTDGVFSYPASAGPFELPPTPAATPTPEPTDAEVERLTDDQIMEVIRECFPWKDEGKILDLLVYEKSVPMFPQATYDVPGYRAEKFVRAIEDRILASRQPASGER